MAKLIKLEWEKLKYPVILATLITSFIIGILTLTLYKSYYLDAKLEAWEIGTQFISFIFPLIVVLPTCWLMYYEKKDNFIMYTMTRANKREYLLSKWIVIAISSFMIIFIAMIVGVLIALYINPIESFKEMNIVLVDGKHTIFQARHVFGELFITKPLLYGFLLSIWRGILSIIMATMGFVFSLYIENIFIILTGPFIYYILENFILAILRLEAYRFVTSFRPESLSSKEINIFSFLTGPLIATIFIFGVIYFFKNIKKTTIYPN